MSASASPGQHSATARPIEEAQHPTPHAWGVLAILCFVYVLNFLDRQLLSILAKPIQEDLGISDGQIGLISGLYFALFYCLLAIPVGWLADRSNRVRVLSFACLLWSAATVACGLAANYPQLALARMSVGVGEAGGVPPSYAIICDYFPPRMRGRALGLFNFGPPIGQALGVAFGASITAAWNWRWAFVFLGAAGIFAALIVWAFVPEPIRGAMDAPAEPIVRRAPPRAPFWPTCRAFFAHPVLLRVSLACAATQFVTYSILTFATLLLMREKGMSLQDVAIYYALVIGISVCAGMYTSGRLIDRFARRTPRAYAWLPAVALTLAIPFFIGFVWAPRWPLALTFLALPTFLSYFYLSPSIALVQEQVPAHARVLAAALLLLVMNLIGLGLGPTFVGAVSDALRPAHPEHSLQLAFYALVPFYGVAVLSFLWLARALPPRAGSGGHS
jgi:predicted MFS family arabinose efflux permease